MMRGTLAAGDDLGDFERTHGVGGPEHDRLLFTMHDPFPEGVYLDRRTFASTEWAEVGGDRELRVYLAGGGSLVIIEDAPNG